MIRTVLHLRAAALLIVLLLNGCAGSDGEESRVAHSWAQMSKEVIGQNEQPVYDSRSLGLLGITMYESIVHGYPDRRSLAGQLSDLRYLPPPDAGLVYDWSTALSSGQAEMLSLLYGHRPPSLLRRIDSLDNHFRRQRIAVAGEPVVRRSSRYGQLIAQQVYEWAKADGGHRSYLNQDFSNWGGNRPLLPANYTMAPPTTAGFERKMLMTPLANYLRVSDHLSEQHPSLIEQATVYALTGIALSDASVKCGRWTGKDPTTVCSGVQSAAVATVLGVDTLDVEEAGVRIGYNIQALQWTR